MDLGIKGKTALVLAAGGGLGRATAMALAMEGASLALCDIDQSALECTVSHISSKTHATVITQALDLNHLAAMGAFVNGVSQTLGDIDILVNISGGPPLTTALATNLSPQQWIDQFQAMVLSLIHVTDLVLPGMRAKRWGRIITSASSGVVAPIPRLGISNTLRSSLVGWSKTLAGEVAVDGITVNVVVPGRIATNRVRELDNARAHQQGKSIEQIIENSCGSIPMRRYGEPEEYGNVVAFLASSKASYITGAMIRIDGGMIPSV
jgi:3-oxoacyl-[acyl-carrier protein] reductase